jgi:hypothetical protein
MFANNLFRSLAPPEDPNAALFDPEEVSPIVSGQNLSWRVIFGPAWCGMVAVATAITAQLLAC